MAGEPVQIFEGKQKLLSGLGWRENPFVKDLRQQDREGFLKYHCPLDGEKIVERLAFDAKAVLLVGPKGVGKTSAIYYTKYSLPAGEFDSAIIKEPPSTLDGLAEELGVGNRPSVLGGLFAPIAGALGIARREKGISRAEIAERLKRRERKLVAFVDEAHLAANPQMYMEFKYLLDEVPQLRMVFCGLDRSPFPDSLMHLIGENNVFARKGFSAPEMKRIIGHRISAVGGSGTHPFSDGALDEVLTEQNLLTPRYVFDELNNRLAKMASGRIDPKEESSRLSVNDPIVQAAIADVNGRNGNGAAAMGAQAFGKITHAHADWWVMLSPSQQKVMELLLEGGGLTLSEVCKRAGLSQNTAFNALYQLRGDDGKELERKKEVPFPLVEARAKLVGGRKKNLYYASEKVRNLFTTT
ncbi:ATP-binding protein [Candidatus Micrarchaeota archaeon]|nr:ATP-binding protein [Candidatus Micrarchaeota archaeon]